MAKHMTGAEMVVEALKDQGVEMVFGYPGRRGAADLRRDLPSKQIAPHPRAPRAGRGPCRGRLRAFDRQGRRSARHLGPRRDQCDHRLDRRAHGFDSARLHHRPGADASHRLRRVSGMRHDRHHPQLHEAQLSRAPHRRPAAHSARGLLHRFARSPRPGRRRHPEGRAIRDRRLHVPEEHSAQDLSTAAQGRSGARSACGRDDGCGEKADLLYGRRRHQFRPARLDALARARARDRVPDHLDADGARGLSRIRQAMARHARHAWLVPGEQRDA